MTDAPVLASRQGRIGHLLLNRPEVLNALDATAIRHLTAVLASWQEEADVHAVVIEGAGPRAFSAGADVRALYGQVRAGAHEAVFTFFREEYALNAAIACYPKPYVALIDGICMGGGIGVSVHGRLRVTTEAGVFAMPETAIALFPDVGATHFLPRLPGALGMFLGLTGHRLQGANAVHAGLATHFVPRARLAELRQALIRDGVAVVASFAEPLPPFSLAPQRALIDRCFSAPTLPEVIAALTAETDPWAAATLAVLRSRSPSALAWSFAALRRGAALELKAALAAELALAGAVTRHPDFAEGVRAMVVDKDRAPRWSPSRLEAVDQDQIAALLRA